MIEKIRSTLQRVPRGLLVISLAMLLWGLGDGLFIFFLPLALQQWQVDAVQTGVILGLMGVPMVFIQLPAGYFADRFGTRPLVITAMLLGITAAALMGFAGSLPVFIAGVLTYGFVALISPPMHSEITTLRGEWSVQRAVTFVSASMLCGAVFGPLIGGRIAAGIEMSAVFRISALLFTVALGAVSLTNRAVRKERNTAAPVRKQLSFSRALVGYLVMIFFAMLLLYMPQQFSTLYLNEMHQVSVEQIGTLGTVTSLGAVVIMFGLGSLLPKFGMQLGQGFMALFSLLLWRGKTLPVFMAGYVFLGGSKLYLSMAEASSLSLVKADQIGFAYGAVATCNALAISAAPMLAGFFYELQPASLYAVSLTGILISMAVTAVYFQRRNQATAHPASD